MRSKCNKCKKNYYTHGTRNNINWCSHCWIRNHMVMVTKYHKPKKWNKGFIQIIKLLREGQR